jgi:hypothetical protein
MVWLIGRFLNGTQGVIEEIQQHSLLKETDCLVLLENEEHGERGYGIGVVLRCLAVRGCGTEEWIFVYDYH